MKANGYFLIGIKKTITLYLWATTKAELEDDLKKGRHIVPCFKDETGHEFIKVVDRMIQIS